MFVLGPKDSYTWPVTVEVATDGGKIEKQEFNARIKRLGQARIEELEAKIKDGEIKDKDLAAEILLGWDGVFDANSKEVPFNDSTKEALLDQALVASAVVTAFFESLTGGKRKN
ncbi:MAG: hypothetical protein SFX19_10150 [Alphaproteobacteria bacterium]|nr:hypothetical protein [Alphaproteobacteria bacterium]